MKFHHSQLPAMPPIGDHAGDGERRVGGEGRRHHRRAGQPPGDVAAGEEEFVDVLSGARLVVEADGEVKKEVERDDEPVDRGETRLKQVIIPLRFRQRT